MVPPRPVLYLVAVLGGTGLTAALLWALVHGEVAWAAIVVPLFGTAVWLLIRKPDHVQTWRLLLFASCLGVSTGLEGPLRVLDRSTGSGGWFVAGWVGTQLLNQACVVAAAVLIAGYPDGVVGRRWHRVAVDVVRWGLALPLILLVARPTLLPDVYLIDGGHPPVASPLYLPALGWLGPPVALIQQNYLIVLVGAR
jgi:hypothetical protein